MRNPPVRRVPVNKPHMYAADKKHYSTAVLLVMLVAAGVLGYRQYVASKPPPVVYQGDDEHIANLIREKGACDVADWLRDPVNSVRGLSNAAATAHARQLKSSGAVQVMAIGRGVSAQLMVELPADDVEARGRIFAWAKDWQTKELRTAPFDSKQRYLLIDMPSGDMVQSLR